MGLREIVLIGVYNAALIAIVQAVATMWLRARLESSIKHEYDKRLEDLRFQFKQREQAAMIAELLAEWSSGGHSPKRLNQLAWEASLWLPSDIVIELAKILCNSPEARPMKELLVDVRRHIKGGSDGVEASHIVHFNPPPNTPELPPSTA